MNQAIANLSTYDWIVVNSSGGKDSQAMTDFIVELAKRHGILDRVVLVHCDLGRVEWKGTKELAEEHAKHYGIRFEVVTRTQDDLLDHVLKRGMWPGSDTRYCTSDHKRGPVGTLFTRLASEWRRDCRLERMQDQWAGIPTRNQCRILNCLGMRADESPARAKLDEFKNDKRNTNGRRRVDVWHPIHKWTTEQVWDRIKKAGTRHHYVYDLGMPRVSCCFCIFAPREALLLAGKHNPELLAQYVEVEKKIDHTFRVDMTLASVQEELASGAEVGKVNDWKM